MSPTRIRQLILEMAKRAGVGHIGSALSIADITAALYGDVLRIVHPDNPNRDRFILSKGHAAMALYAALYLKRWLTKQTLETYCMDPMASESKEDLTRHSPLCTHHCLGVHPEHVTPGVDFSTGSLGHGLAIGTGAALAARIEGCSRRVFVLISDAECNEGSIWESVMLAAHHRLANLIAIIDLNSQQAFGYTDEVLNLSPMREKWEAFGWNVHEVDGHNVAEITETIRKLNTTSDSPHVLIARTTFGKGVSYMENRIKWHYMPMSDTEYLQAVEEVESGK